MKQLKSIVLPLFIFFLVALLVQGDLHYYDFVLKETNVTKLCEIKQIMTVNDSFPGPEIRVRKGDTVYVNFYNQGLYGVTLHWHGVKNPRNSWSDGPEYITQCPINPGQNFTYEVIFSDEEGTLWWHAHSDWTRATVHGAIVILPEDGTSFPFPEPDGEEVIVLGSWFKEDLITKVAYGLETGSDLPHACGYTINGELGDFSNCSSNETIFYWTVDYGKTYLLRIINAESDDEMFFSIAEHNLTVVGMDGAYLKSFVTSYIMISPGNTVDVLVTTNQSIDDRYYMASRQFSTETQTLTYTVGTAILQYNNNNNNGFDSPIFPSETLPSYEDYAAGSYYTSQLRSLASEEHPINVPIDITTRMYIVISVDELPCPSTVNCTANTRHVGTTTSASMNNISWWADTSTNILESYYSNMTSGIYTTDFPDWPATFFNFTGDDYDNAITVQGTKVKVLDYNETVEVVFQGDNLLGGSVDHPMHFHGHSFYVVGSGLGNFNNETDPSSYNLVDPPEVNTFGVPKLGWLAIRFRANNPGVWYWHCHFDRHMSWGMDTVFIVKNGDTEETSLRPPPTNLPSCSINPTDVLTERSSPSGFVLGMD